LRDFDAIRDMLADDVHLELVNRVRLKGRQPVGVYYHRYAEAPVSWRCVPGLVDGAPAVLMPDADGRPSSSCWIGPAARSRAFATSCSPAMPWRAPRSASGRGEQSRRPSPAAIPIGIQVIQPLGVQHLHVGALDPLSSGD
jgi:hypothetical protein